MSTEPTIDIDVPYVGKYTQEEIRKYLSDAEITAIEDKVLDNVKNVRKYANLHFDYCSYCQRDLPLSKRFKTRVIYHVNDLSAECGACYAKRRVRELIDEAIDRKKNVRNPEKPESTKSTVVEEKQINKTYKPSFDLDDFKRI